MTKNLEEKTHKEQLEMLGTFSLEEKNKLYGKYNCFQVFEILSYSR